MSPGWELVSGDLDREWLVDGGLPGRTFPFDLDVDWSPGCGTRGCLGSSAEKLVRSTDKLTHRQTGQVPLALSQGVMHGSWKTCWHGSVTTINSSGFSALRENCSLHIAQSFSRVSAVESQRVSSSSF